MVNEITSLLFLLCKWTPSQRIFKENSYERSCPFVSHLATKLELIRALFHKNMILSTNSRTKYRWVWSFDLKLTWDLIEILWPIVWVIILIITVSFALNQKNKTVYVRLWKANELEKKKNWDGRFRLLLLRHEIIFLLNSCYNTKLSHSSESKSLISFKHFMKFSW